MFLYVVIIHYWTFRCPHITIYCLVKSLCGLHRKILTLQICTCEVHDIYCLQQVGEGTGTVFPPCNTLITHIQEHRQCRLHFSITLLFPTVGSCGCSQSRSHFESWVGGRRKSSGERAGALFFFSSLICCGAAGEGAVRGQHPESWNRRNFVQSFRRIGRKTRWNKQTRLLRRYWENPRITQPECEAPLPHA